jgi:hypothetical protein
VRAHAIQGWIVSSKEPIDAVELAQRVTSILHTGRREATYKLATLSALIELCQEGLPTDRAAALDVAIDDLARRVIALYWRQRLPFVHTERATVAGLVLRQHTNPVSLILGAIDDLRHVVGQKYGEIPVALAAERCGDDYARAADYVGMYLCREPLRRLQDVPNVNDDAPVESFMYDAGWMTKSIGRKAILTHGDMIVLRPGVAWGLARLGGLLKPAVEIAWVDEVLDKNADVAAHSTFRDIRHHLFGGYPRVALTKVGGVLKDRYGRSCFYCHTAPATHVDHVLPWWRVGIDGIANLVPACRKCNLNKSGLLPAPEHVARALERPGLHDVAEIANWPYDWTRTRSAARGVFFVELKSPAWERYGHARPVGDLQPLPPILSEPTWQT